MQELLVFDGDDTLWFVEVLYDEARAEARGVVERAGLDGAEWDRRQRRIDVENVTRMGLSPDRFPKSCVDAYGSIAIESSSAIDAAVKAAVEDAARRVFERVAPLSPDAVGVLTELSADYRLALLTKGDEGVQRKRIADSGLEGFFEVVAIVADKDRAAFRSILGAALVTPDHAWSIGNSIPSDINPAIEVGMSGIWIDAHVWEHERRELVTTAGQVIEVQRLSEVPAALPAARLHA